MKPWIVMLLPMAILPAQQAKVIDEGTGWSVLGGKQLKRGDAVPATATLKGTGAADLVLECASRWYSYSCGGNSCQVPVCSEQSGGVKIRRVDPYAWAAPPDAPSLGDVVKSFFTREPKSVATLGVRGAGNLTDAVVRQIGDRVLWAPALIRVLEGVYCFQLDRLPAGSSAKSVTFRLDWDPEDKDKKDGAVHLPGLAAGTYTLRRGTSGEAGNCRVGDPDAMATWVVVVPDSRFTRIQAQWEGYSAGLEKLAQDASPAVTSTVRHAMLSYLADSLTK